jgi:hypothetical protein
MVLSGSILRSCAGGDHIRSWREIDEECLEVDGAYRDKSLGLWRLSQLYSHFHSN